MSKTISVYLAGGMKTNWQSIVESSFVDYEDVVFINPMYNNTNDLQEIVGIDLFGVKQCDIIFAYLEEDNPSGYGMTFEIGYGLALGKTVILVNEQSESNVYTTFADGAVDILSESFDSGLLSLHKMLNIFYKRVPHLRIT